MSVLSDEELWALVPNADNLNDARAIEAAILAKLASAELPNTEYAYAFGGSDLERRFSENVNQAHAKGFVAGAAAQLAEKPIAWSVTYNGEHTGNFNLKRYDAEDRRDSLSRVYPNDKREVVELYTRREA